MRAYQDQRRPPCFRARLSQCACDRRKIVAVLHPYRVPPVAIEAGAAIFRERDVGTGRQRHVIVIVQANQFAEFQMSGQRGSLRSDAFHQVAITEHCISVMIDQSMSRSVVARSELGFCDGHADGIGHPLSQRPGCDLNARRVSAFRMPGRLAAPLAELPNVIERERVAGQIQQAVEQRRSVPCREHEAITIDPIRIDGVEFKKARP